MRLMLILATTESDDDGELKSMLEQFPYRGPTYGIEIQPAPTKGCDTLDDLRMLSFIASGAIKAAHIESIKPGPHGLTGKERKDAR